jgi:hypothetical protein
MDARPGCSPVALVGGRRLATKVCVFIDFLAKVFAAEPSFALDQRRK